MLIELHNPHWLSQEKPEIDLCAHGGVEIRANDLVISDGIASNWTISAAALYLLRTVSQDHTRGNPICEQLIPCCGFSMWDQGDGRDVLILGCPNGIDFEVRLQGDKVVLTSENNEKTTMTHPEWQQAVFRFADTVEEFYRSSKPKQPEDEQSAQGYKAFWAEWQRRRNGGAIQGQSPAC